MYALCVNDIVKIFKYAKLLMYSDDTFIYAIINNDVDRNMLYNVILMPCMLSVL